MHSFSIPLVFQTSGRPSSAMSTIPTRHIQTDICSLSAFSQMSDELRQGYGTAMLRTTSPTSRHKSTLTSAWPTARRESFIKCFKICC